MDKEFVKWVVAHRNDINALGQSYRNVCSVVHEPCLAGMRDELLKIIGVLEFTMAEYDSINSVEEIKLKKVGA